MSRRPKQAYRATAQTVSALTHIRWMIRRDMPEVLAIELRSFEFPWTEDDFINCLRQRRVNGLVAELDEKIVGYMLYELRKQSICVHNFAVGPAWRRKTVGTQMICTLKSKIGSDPDDRKRLVFEVRETNLAAQLFLRRHDFRATRVLRNAYDDTREDAYRMEFILPGPVDASIE